MPVPRGQWRADDGTGWIPYFLDRLDRVYDRHHVWTGQDFDGLKPSEVFRKHFITCFITDPVGIQHRRDIGVENICWELDYPHSDSEWPHAPEKFIETYEQYEVPDDEINAISHENAMRLYHFDPFGIRPKSQSTVGVLRSEVADHNIATRSYDKGRHHTESGTTVDQLMPTG